MLLKMIPRLVCALVLYALMPLLFVLALFMELIDCANEKRRYDALGILYEMAEVCELIWAWATRRA